MPYKGHKAEGSTYDAAYYIAHSGRILAYQAAYRAKYPERKRAANARYRSSHSVDPSAPTYYSTHRDKARASHKAYHAAHPAEMAAKCAKRRAFKHTTAIGNPAAIKAIYRRARETKNVKCYLCGKLIPLGERHVDHIIPLSRGGPHSSSNLAIAHALCNIAKSDKMPEALGLLL